MARRAAQSGESARARARSMALEAKLARVRHFAPLRFAHRAIHRGFGRCSSTCLEHALSPYGRPLRRCGAELAEVVAPVPSSSEEPVASGVPENADRRTSLAKKFFP